MVFFNIFRNGCYLLLYSDFSIHLTNYCFFMSMLLLFMCKNMHNPLMSLPFLIKSPEKLYQKQRRCCIHNVMLLQHLGRDNDQNCKYQRKSLIPFRHLLRTFHTFPAHPAHIAVDRGKQIRRTVPAIQEYTRARIFSERVFPGISGLILVVGIKIKQIKQIKCMVRSVATNR